ncbi:MAG: 4-alpha-glucanotransferase [Planctomycetes bacterium]|nr:4-alpha-glucanotransferase [Planctomycetota bacterium]
MRERASGVLLHITSLPSKYGIGDLGPGAYNFIDFLIKAKQRYWQVLPLNPTDCSPYNSTSAFAGNTLLLSPELLYQQGLLTRKEIQPTTVFPERRVGYRLVISHKTKLLKIVFERFQKTAKKSGYERFCSENETWLEDFAMFSALRQHFGYRLWCDWPTEIRDRKKQALKSIKSQLAGHIDREKFLQYMFFQQWHSLKQYCNRHGIKIIGDIPIYVSRESAEPWAHPEYFKLTNTKKPRVVAGVPPDSFSRTGQLWGNPVYNWQVLKKRGYSWWIERIKQHLNLFDIIRIDHFRGFIAYWEVPASDKTAKNGKWVKGPGEDFFKVLFEHFPSKSFVVEDLGYITEDVIEVIKKFQLPCTRVLLSAFRGEPATNRHYPHNHVTNCVVYTSTHDNNTIKGWFEKESKPEVKRRLFDYLGRVVPASELHWELIRLAMSSVANLTIIPMQDILGLGEQARMNRPGTVRNNWVWRLGPKEKTASIVKKLARLTEIFGRA